MIPGTLLFLVGVGLLAVVAVLVHRLLAANSLPHARVGVDGVQEAEIVVDAGYHPDGVVLQQGRPARLNFVRRENGECSDWVVIPALNIARKLAPFGTTLVEFMPDREGEFIFSCRFNVCRGRLTVQQHPGLATRASKRKGVQQ